MPSLRPSLEQCFAIYADAIALESDPIAEHEQRVAFYCGFEACMQVVDVIATISHISEEQGVEAWNSLQAEYDKFATEHDCGKLSINH